MVEIDNHSEFWCITVGGVYPCLVQRGHHHVTCPCHDIDEKCSFGLKQQSAHSLAQIISWIKKCVLYTGDYGTWNSSHLVPKQYQLVHKLETQTVFHNIH